MPSRDREEGIKGGEYHEETVEQKERKRKTRRARRKQTGKIRLTSDASQICFSTRLSSLCTNE